jgi:geranylgeranyl pyrophosphate synthase
MTIGSKLDSLDIEQLCDRLTAGESQTAIAKSLKVNVATLCRWIAADPQRSARVREARIAASRSFDEMAEQVLKSAKNPFGLAKARELASHYRWKASKANPKEYGEKIEVDQRTTFAELTDEQIDARIAKHLAAGG